MTRGRWRRSCARAGSGRFTSRAANAARKPHPNKPARKAARARAQIRRGGGSGQVHVKSRKCRLWRSLLVARRTVLNEMRAIENVVRAVLREAGLKLGTPARAAFAGRVRELAGDDRRANRIVPVGTMGAAISLSVVVDT